MRVYLIFFTFAFGNLWRRSIQQIVRGRDSSHLFTLCSLDAVAALLLTVTSFLAVTMFLFILFTNTHIYTHCATRSFAMFVQTISAKIIILLPFMFDYLILSVRCVR